LQQKDHDTVKILVVDPEAEIRLLFFINSDELQCESFFASGGEEALEILCEHGDIGLYLISTQLPDMDASALAERLRGTEGGSMAAIVFLSRSEDTELLVSLLRYGDDVVIKPFSQAVLLAKLVAMQRTRKLYLQLDERNRQLEQFRARTEAEVQIAQDVFSRLEAQDMPAIAGITTFQSACSPLSGDLLLIAPRPGEGFNVLIADITGHGLPAALGTIPIAETFYAMSTKGFGVGDMAREMNKVFRKRMPDYLLCAAVLMAVQDSGRRLQIWVGGMPPCLIYGAEGKVKDILRSKHMALGAQANHEFDDSVFNVQLDPGEQVLCFSDGITDATNKSGEIFGPTEFIAALEGPLELSVVDRIVNRLRPFVGDAELDDDITLFCFNNREYVQMPIERLDNVASATVNGFTWKTNFRFEAEQLRSESPLDLVFSALPEHPILRAARADLSFIIGELFVNALDHGVLLLESSCKEEEEGLHRYYDLRAERLANLDAGFVELGIGCEVSGNVGKFHIVCTDSGHGFDLTKVLGHAADDSRHSGRGLSTIAAMCDEVTSNITSNSIAVHYRWPGGRLLAA